MPTKKKKQEPKAIVGGEEEVISVNNKKIYKREELIASQASTRASIDGEVYIMLYNIYNDIWGCVKEYEKGFFAPGQELIIMQIKKENLIL